MTIRTNYIVFIILLMGTSFTLQAQSKTQEPNTHRVEWQKPGMEIKKGLDAYALRDDDGIIYVWNQFRPYFKTKVIGKEIKGAFDGDSAYFLVDGIFLQIMPAEAAQFL